jgi:hypothetical protein
MVVIAVATIRRGGDGDGGGGSFGCVAVLEYL